MAGIDTPNRIRRNIFRYLRLLPPGSGEVRRTIVLVFLHATPRIDLLKSDKYPDAQTECPFKKLKSHYRATAFYQTDAETLSGAREGQARRRGFASSQRENPRQERKSLPSATAPVIAAPTEHKQQYDHQDNDLKHTHDLVLPWAKTRPGFG